VELDFDSEQEALRDSVRAFLDRECPIGLVREIVEARIEGGAADAGALHAQMVELGWAAFSVPEDAGGLGLGPIEVALVAEELGRALTPGPLFATLTQFVPLVRALGTDAQVATMLGPVAAGTAAGTVAVAGPTGGVDPAATPIEATPTGSGVTLTGRAALVIEPDPEGSVAVVARTAGSTGDDGIAAYVVPVAACTVSAIDAVDPSRVLADVTFAGVAAPVEARLGDPGPATATAIRRALDLATVGLALDAVGAGQALFDLSLEYVKQREQFGVPIGSFQSMKHKFADLLVLLERARALGYFAALTIAEDDDRRALAASMAKAAAGDAAARLAKEGIQVHGGIGYTWEADVHLYVRRLESDAVLFGNADQHRRQVATLLGV
jgi:alkylation response protein AidB-like acyl-CoA dehydrogenase